MKSIKYVYEFYDDSNNPVYIGISSDPNSRIKTHVSVAKSKKRKGLKMSPLESWIVKSIENNGVVNARITKECMSGEVYEAELKRILELTKSGIGLLNRLKNPKYKKSDVNIVSTYKDTGRIQLVYEMDINFYKVASEKINVRSLFIDLVEKNIINKYAINQTTP